MPFPLVPQPKAPPHRLVTQRRAASVRTTDRQERETCHARSGGRCEVIERGLSRCPRYASENHHLIKGSGRRNKGRSILAAHRLDTCHVCHSDITGNVLVPAVSQDKAECAATVRYKRIVLKAREA